MEVGVLLTGTQVQDIKGSICHNGTLSPSVLVLRRPRSRAHISSITSCGLTMDNCLWFAVAQEIRNCECTLGKRAVGTDNRSHLDGSWFHMVANKLALPFLVSYTAGAKGTLGSYSHPSEIQPVAGAQQYFCFAIDGCSLWISIRGQQRGEDMGLQAHGDLSKRKFTIFPSPMHHFLSVTLLLLALFFENSTLNIPSL